MSKRAAPTPAAERAREPEPAIQPTIPALGGAAVFLLCLFYAAHVLFCQWSVLPYFPYLFRNSDMYANLQWAKSICDQGWLNPRPYHPYVDWMQRVGTQEEWLHWWGGPATFQQAPLYAYFLALFQSITPNLLYVEVVQAFLAVLLCGLLGRLTFELTRNRAAGWVAFALAGAYSPFYAYSWTTLRDLLGWLLTAALLLSLVRLQRSKWTDRGSSWTGFITGTLLGLGVLVRETFLLIAPAVMLVLAWQSWHRTPEPGLAKRADAASSNTNSPKRFRPLLACFAGVCVFMAPLVVRNLVVGLPPLAVSNRFADTFIQGHSAHGHPYLYVVPDDMRTLLICGQQGKFALIRATLKTHGGFLPFCRFELSKALSLLDPYEPPDNLSIYFLADISPFVQWGLRHWILIIPGLAGLVWSLVRRETRQFWLWVLFPMVLAGVLVGVPVSRYRQALAIFWIPWTACFALWLFQARHNRKTLTTATVCVLGGWALCLGPFSRQPRAQYERPAEFVLSAYIYDQLGQTNEAQEIRAQIQAKFPSALLPGNQY